MGRKVNEQAARKMERLFRVSLGEAKKELERSELKKKQQELRKRLARHREDWDDSLVVNH
jgi:hypothetical protein